MKSKKFGDVSLPGYPPERGHSYSLHTLMLPYTLNNHNAFVTWYSNCIDCSLGYSEELSWMFIFYVYSFGFTNVYMYVYVYLSLFICTWIHKYVNLSIIFTNIALSIYNIYVYIYKKLSNCFFFIRAKPLFTLLSMYERFNLSVFLLFCYFMLTFRRYRAYE